MTTGTALDLRFPVGPQLTDLLRELIVTSVLVPGERMSEIDVGRQYGISRQTVREAFIKLSEENLLEIRPQRGTYVRKISLRDVENARFIREAIETDIVSILAQDRDPALIAELRTQLAQQETAAHHPEDRVEFRRLDDVFHVTLAQAAGRGELWQVLDSVKSQMDRVRHMTIKNLQIVRLVAQHREIVDGIDAGDAQMAVKATRNHLRTILSDLEAHLRDTPDIFEGLDLPWHDARRPIVDPANG
jgi:DNA-binding GntR family transcriptional regulator